MHSMHAMRHNAAIKSRILRINYNINTERPHVTTGIQYHVKDKVRDTIYDTRCYSNVLSKADISPFFLPQYSLHGFPRLFTVTSEHICL